MTSRTLFSTDTRRPAGFLARQRALFRRRLWPAAMLFVSFLLYHIVLVATALHVSRREAALARMSAADTTRSLQHVIRALLGSESPCWLLIIPFAVILAVEGFAWMDSRREVDFYESLPVPRGQRFRDICLGSLLYFLFSYLLTLEAGLLIAGSTGALTRPVLIDVLHAAAESIALFLSVYALGVLAAMLTGNVVTACLAFLVLALYEPVCKAVLAGYCSEYFATWSGQDGTFLDICVFSPVYHFFYGSTWIKSIAAMLGLAVLFFLLAWIAWRLRKNECAGTAVVFGPVRTVVRVAMAMITGLVTGLFIVAIASKGDLLVLFWALLFTVLSACIMQIIYEYNFRALFHRPLEIAAACLLVVAVYLIFLLDIPGYDRFVPDPAKVSDAALTFTSAGDFRSLYNEAGDAQTPDDYGAEYMHLDNVEDVIALAAYGQEYTCSTRSSGTDSDSSETDTFESGGFNYTVTKSAGAELVEYEFAVLWRMKDGRKISRCFRLPSSTDPAMMDAVIGTPAWRQGAFNIYHDTPVRAAADGFVMEYTNALAFESAKMTAASYADFSEAYRTDLAQFSYSFAKASHPVGLIELNYDSFRGGSSLVVLPGNAEQQLEMKEKLDQMYISYPVYPEFTNTIDFLRQQGIWLDPLDESTLPRGNYDQLSPNEQNNLNMINLEILNGPFNRNFYY